VATRRVRTTSPARRARSTKKRTRRLAAQPQDLTVEQWTDILDAWGHGCAYCGTPAADLTQALHRDCVLPVARGGRYTVTNVVPACRSCNSSKAHDEVTGWLRRKGLDEASFLLRWRAALDQV
jgi:5-methylcytosine-specific restriction endonuclease McrA